MTLSKNFPIPLPWWLCWGTWSQSTCWGRKRVCEFRLVTYLSETQRFCFQNKDNIHPEVSLKDQLHHCMWNCLAGCLGHGRATTRDSFLLPFSADPGTLSQNKPNRSSLSYHEIVSMITECVQCHLWPLQVFSVLESWQAPFLCSTQLSPQCHLFKRSGEQRTRYQESVPWQILCDFG